MVAAFKDYFSRDFFFHVILLASSTQSIKVLPEFCINVGISHLKQTTTTLLTSSKALRSSCTLVPYSWHPFGPRIVLTAHFAFLRPSTTTQLPLTQSIVGQNWRVPKHRWVPSSFPSQLVPFPAFRAKKPLIAQVATSECLGTRKTSSFYSAGHSL